MSNIIHKRIYFDDGAVACLVLILFSQLFLSNGIYLFLGSICFWWLFTNLQQPLKPSVFTIVLIYHIIQIMSGIWLSNYMHEGINFRSDHADVATITAFFGVFFMFLPIIYFQNKIPNISLATFRKHAQKMSIERTLRVYIVSFFVGNALTGIAFVYPGLSQIIFSFVNIKWFFFLLFGFQAILKKRMIKQLIFFICLEFILGFFSYFSDFKIVMFFIGFIAIVFLAEVKLKHVIIAAIAIGGLTYLGILWTSVKGEYRAFLNQGTKSQSVNVERGDALNKLVELSGKNMDDNFDQAAVSFFDRIQYTYHLAKTMDRVPAILPHEDGQNISNIISFVTTPRFLNPNKPKLEATVKATKYTGIMYAGALSGTSFSLGYFADCYIDFGYFGMMVPLIILGFIFGATYFYFIKKSSPNFIFNYAVVGAMFMEFHAFESDGTYVMGRLFSTLLTFFMLKMILFPALYRYLAYPTQALRKPTEGVAQETLQHAE